MDDRDAGKFVCWKCQDVEANLLLIKQALLHIGSLLLSQSCLHGFGPFEDVPMRRGQLIGLA